MVTVRMDGYTMVKVNASKYSVFWDTDQPSILVVQLPHTQVVAITYLRLGVQGFYNSLRMKILQCYITGEFQLNVYSLYFIHYNLKKVGIPVN